MIVTDMSELPKSDEEIREIINIIKKKPGVYSIMAQSAAIVCALTELLFRRRAMDRQEEEEKICRMFMVI